jgi:ribosomal protein L37AE/L43A
MIRFLLILLVSAFSALGFVTMTNNPVLFKGIEMVIDVAGAAGIGLTAGFFTRVLLARRSAFLRWIVSLAGVMTGLLVLGRMTGWEYGIGPLSFNRATTDWLGLGLVVLGSLLTLISDRAYRGALPLHSMETPAVASLSTIPAAPARNINTRSQRSSAETRSTSWRITGQRQRNVAVNKPKKRIVKKKKPVSLAKQKTSSKPTVIKKRASKKIVIAPVEEHRCPYCLEPVKRNDPRGVVECSICHTLHHADCWAITGTCQVPHYNH